MMILNTKRWGIYTDPISEYGLERRIHPYGNTIQYLFKIYKLRISYWPPHRGKLIKRYID